MDIRNFFGKQPAGKKSGASKSATKKTATTTTTKKATTKRSEKAIVDDDGGDSATTDEELHRETTTGKERKKKSVKNVMESDSDATTDAETPPGLHRQKQKSKKKTAVGDKKEVSPEDYFASSSSSSKTKKQLKPVTVKKQKDDDGFMSSDSEDRKKGGTNKKQNKRVQEDKTKNKRTVFMDSDSSSDEAPVMREKKRPALDDDFLSSSDSDSKHTNNNKNKKKRIQQEKNKKRSVCIDIDSDTDNDKDQVKQEDSWSDSDGHYEDDEPKKKKTKQTAKTTPKKSPAKSPKKSPKRSPKKSNSNTPPAMPDSPIANYPLDSVQTTDIFQSLTFVFSGVLSPNLSSREDAEDYVKSLGGRVTKAVSGKTNYLVLGDTLEDGRPAEEGTKFKKAKALGPNKVAILKGEGMLFALVKLMDDQNKSKENELTSQTQESRLSASSAGRASTASTSTAVSSASAGTVTSNPYAKRGRPVNPYAKKKPTQQTQSPQKAHPTSPSASISNNGMPLLWSDKYAPKHSRDVLGNQENVRKLTLWLAQWEERFNTPQARSKTFSAPGGPWKAALLSGPPGIGKTTTAMLVAQESGRDVLERNASDVRSKKALNENMGDVTGSQVLQFAPTARKKEKKRCIIMDEVDGMGAGDRSGISELIKMIKDSLVPIICICNDRQSQKIRSLVPYCLDLRYRRPTKSVIARRAVQVGQCENMHVQPNAAEAIAESCGNDVRQVLNLLQMWSNKKNASVTYRDVKDRQNMVNKDEMLRVGLFDATRMLVEGCRGVPGGTQTSDVKAANASLFKRSDAYFVDYNLMGLNVHQNYLKVMIAPFQETKKKDDAEAELEVLERMCSATEAMSDFAVAEHGVRGGDMNWGLLPLCSILAVKVGHHAGGPNGGFLPGYPEFSAWLGKNSSRGKMSRLLGELRHHLNYNISADVSELRLQYLPVLRKHLLQLLMDKTKRDDDGPTRTEEAIAFMDEYGLDRDDVFENLDEFTLDNKADKFADLDSKSKAAFTREYNKGAHKSQALVDEQGVAKTKKKRGGDKAESGVEAGDLDAVDDDKAVKAEDEEESDEEFDADAVKALFSKKKGGGGGKKKRASSTSPDAPKKAKGRKKR